MTDTKGAFTEEIIEVTFKENIVKTNKAGYININNSSHQNTFNLTNSVEKPRNISMSIMRIYPDASILIYF
jgi:hypothetical protein